MTKEQQKELDEIVGRLHPYDVERQNVEAAYELGRRHEREEERQRAWNRGAK